MNSRILKENCELKGIFIIKNSIRLIQKLENIEVNTNMNLTTVDVKDMFTNISNNKDIALIQENKRRIMNIRKK